MTPRFETRAGPIGSTDPIKFCHDCRRALDVSEDGDTYYRVPIQGNWQSLPENKIRYEGWVVCATDAARRGLI